MLVAFADGAAGVEDALGEVAAGVLGADAGEVGADRPAAAGDGVAGAAADAAGARFGGEELGAVAGVAGVVEGISEVLLRVLLRDRPGKERPALGLFIVLVHLPQFEQCRVRQRPRRRFRGGQGGVSDFAQGPAALLPQRGFARR